MEFENTEFGGITCLVFSSFRISPASCCSGGATGRIQGTSCGSGGPLSAGGDTIFLDLRNFGSTPGTTSAICWDVDCASFAQRFLRSLRAFPLLNSQNFLKGKKTVTGYYRPKMGITNTSHGLHFHFFPPPTNWVRLSWPSLSPPKAKEEEPPEAPEGLVTDETEEKESDRVKAQPFRTKGT